MSGIYTETRDLSTPLEVKIGWRGVYTDRLSANMPGQQVTTSYRSGARADALEALSPDTSIWEKPRLSRNSPADTGHDFYSRTERFAGSSFTFHDWKTDYNTINYGDYRMIDGPLLISEPNEIAKYGYPKVRPLSEGQGTYLGTRLLKMAVPTSPSANAATMLGELVHDGLPAVVLSTLKSRSKLARSAGNDYLNVEFGWKPLVSDVLKLVRSLKKANAIVKQYERDSGRFVRRRVKLPALQSVSTVESAPIYEGSYPYSVRNLGWALKSPTTKWTSTYIEDAWFSGAFTYFVQTDSSVLAKLERYEQLGNQLLGSRITPKTLWELAPWSWLADWFFNIGDNLSNAVSFQNDGLVLQYGYVMRKTLVTTVAEHAFYRFDLGGYSNVTSVRNTFQVAQKERAQATPYGFGLNPNSFSVRQWAILGALGLTH